MLDGAFTEAILASWCRLKFHIFFLLAVTDENTDSESEIEERSKGSTD